MGFLAGSKLSWAQGVSFVRVVVEDPSDAVIVGADVALRDAKGRIVAHGLTDNAGRYDLGPVAPGDYELSIRKEGFTDKKLHIKTDASLRLSHIRMEVAAVRTQVEVGGAAPHVSPDTVSNQSTQQPTPAPANVILDVDANTYGRFSLPAAAASPSTST